jgi:broad specificity phosphatase PhoE
MKIIFVRHGESEANLLREFSNRGTKHPLTETGRRQAAELAHDLRDLKPTRIYTSPILRARQTAEVLADALSAPVEVADALREYDVGEYEGRTDQESWDHFMRVFHAWMRDGDFEPTVPGGESYDEIRRRFEPFVAGLMAEYSGRDDVIVCVGHGGTYRCMLPLVLSNVDRSFVVANGLSYAMAIRTETRNGELLCLKWGELQVCE